MNNTTTDKIDFRKSLIMYRDGWTGEIRTCRFQGNCVLCGTRTFGFDDGQDDPRGPLGDHANADLIASEYDMRGPDVPACFLCQNNTESQYKAVLDIAMRKWRRFMRRNPI